MSIRSQLQHRLGVGLEELFEFSGESRRLSVSATGSVSAPKG
jgi:hypothetical protein